MDVNELSELSELQNFIDIKSSDIYKICYIRHQIIITNPKYYLNWDMIYVYDMNYNSFENSLTNLQTFVSIMIAFLSFYIHLGYYKNMAVCIYTSTDLYQYLYRWINNETHHQCHRYKIYRFFFPVGYSPIFLFLLEFSYCKFLVYTTR